MEKEKLLLLKEFLKKEVSLSFLKRKFKLSELEIMGLISQLKQNGSNILSIKKNGQIYIIDYGDNSLENDDAYYIELKGTELNFAVISDTRLCSKYQQLSILNDIYEKAYGMDVSYVLHCGDISEGVYKGKKVIFNETLFLHGVSEQADYIVDNYPIVNNMKTLFITGEHDLSHLTSENVDIGKIISHQRPDLEYLGKRRKRIIIKNQKNKEILNILMIHPEGKIPYTISYKPQRYISAMRSEDKTDILLHGHWLQTERMLFRGITEYSIPSVVSTTPEMEISGDQNTLGAWILKFYFDKEGKFINSTPIFIPYYKTIENDYKKCKSLKIGGK